MLKKKEEVMLAKTLSIPRGRVAAVMLACLLVPQMALGLARVLDIHDPLADFDSRDGLVAPTASQQALVDSLGATARWNRFGTPQSLIKYGGYLATGLDEDPETAARAWLAAHAELFRLSAAEVEALELVNVARFAGSEAAAVLLRQSFGGLAAGAGSGLITVGVAGGQVAYVSSSAAGAQGEPLPALLSPADAWLNAATEIGYQVLPLEVTDLGPNLGWTELAVLGLADVQRARLVAFPLPGGGVRAAFETIVLDVDGGHAAAYTSFVDARTGEVLARFNRVQRLAREEEGWRRAAASAQDTRVFQGSYTEAPDPPACGPRHGPYVVPPGFVRVVVTAFTAVAANDILINLYEGTDLVATGDSGTSPEALLYQPAGGVPAGSYFVEVCPYQPPTAPPLPPYTYVGTITWEDTAQPTLFHVPRWNVFLATPQLDLSTTDTRGLACWTLVDYQGVPVPGCDLELENLAARAPWDHDVRLGGPTFTTLGNAASSAEAWGSPLTPAEGYRPVSATRDYDFPWSNTWQTSRCSPLAFTAPGTTQANDVDAATANLFAMHNRMHNWSYRLGFTERNYNLQLNNFGLTDPSRENDPEVGNVQAGAVSGGAPSYQGRDNANQITLNDGIPGITNMYLWQPIAGAFYPPCVDGDYDMGVIGHEYTHAISNRLAGGPDGGLSGAQAGAMGESWSDLNAAEYLNEYGLVPVSGENPFAIGTYVAGNPQLGIRNYGMNASPLNFGNVGYDLTGPQVHADSEIWSATNFDIRQLLIDKYDSLYPAADADLQRRCADGEESLQHCPGNRRWIQTVYDALLLMPGAVSMLDARDAYLAADMLRTGGADQRELWLGFARRGFGRGATTAGVEDDEPTPSFASPLESNARVGFKVVALEETVPCGGCNDERGRKPLAAKIYVGHYEARSTPLVLTVADHTHTPQEIEFAPGTYEFLVVADGYGHFRFQRKFSAGQTATFIPWVPTNWASKSQGASATGDGDGLDRLIDDTENTTWEHTGALPDVGGSQVTVRLANAPRTVRRVQVSALLEPGQNRFTALRQFEIWACTESPTNPDCLLDVGFSKIFTSPADAFPGAAPRPNAPDLTLRAFDVPATRATHLRVRVVSNQCTGSSLFSGPNLDNDPLNTTDCRVGNLLIAPQHQDVRIAELQAFNRGGGVGVPGDPVVSLTMTGPSSAGPGAYAEYEIRYLNLGPEPSMNARVTDELPDGLEFVSATGGGTYDPATRAVTWELGTVPVTYSGAVRLTARVAADAAIGTSLLNQARFTGDLTHSPPTAAVLTLVLP